MRHRRRDSPDRDRDGSIATRLRAALATEARGPFDDLCGSLILLTATLSRARRSGASETELETLELHAGRAIAIARTLGEFIHARTAAEFVSVSNVARDLATLIEALPPPRPTATLHVGVTRDLVTLPRAKVESELAAAVGSALVATNGVGAIEIAVEAGGNDRIVVHVRNAVGTTVDVWFQAAS